MQTYIKNKKLEDKHPDNMDFDYQLEEPPEILSSFRSAIGIAPNQGRSVEVINESSILYTSGTSLVIHNSAINKVSCHLYFFLSFFLSFFFFAAAFLAILFLSQATDLFFVSFFFFFLRLMNMVIW